MDDRKPIAFTKLLANIALRASWLPGRYDALMRSDPNRRSNNYKRVAHPLHPQGCFVVDAGKLLVFNQAIRCIHCIQ
jgi:hypothetical protein